MTLNVLLFLGNAVLFFAWLRLVYLRHVEGECPFCGERKR